MLVAYLDPATNAALADPIRNIDPELPISVLCMHGENDPLVDPQNSVSFVEALNQGQTKSAEARILPNHDHTDLLELFLPNDDAAAPMLQWLNA